MTAPRSTHLVSAVAHLPGGDYVLEVKDASVTLDNSWVPYGQLTLTCVRPPEAVLEELDPREDNVRVTVTATRKSGPYIGDTGSGLEHLWESEHERVFDVLLVSREAGATERSIVVRCDTDEALLLGDALLDTTPDSYPFSIQDSLREIIDYVLDRHGTSLYTPGGPPFDPANEEGEADASLFYYEDSTNLVTNPSAETNTTGWTAQLCTLGRLASGVSGVHGSYVFQLTTPTGTENYMWIDIPVTPGETYVFGGLWYAFGTPTGAASTYARCLFVTPTTGGTSLVGPLNPSPAGTLPSSAMQQVTGEVTIPAGVTTVRFRAYGGYTTTENIRWDALYFRLKPRTLDLIEETYFDGASTDTDIYTYAWTGTANNSTSTRTVVDGASADYDAFTWEPGVSAWDFLEPLVQASGLRLYCDEARVWHLVDPARVPAGAVTIAEETNLLEANESVSRYAEWFDAVVVRYQWTTAAGVSRVKYDVASEVVGTPKAVLRIDERRPYPGPGYAAAVLHRAEGRGRVFGITALSDYRVTPGDALTAVIPDTPEQNGRVSAVTWTLRDRRMTVRSSGLIDISPTAWLELDAGEEWLDSPVGESWLEETA